MKRKFLSILLASAMALSLFAIVPVSVSADGEEELKPYRCGDVDGNGIVNINDVLEILKHLAGMKSTVSLDFTPSWNAATGMTRSAEPEIAGVLEILKFLAGMNGYLKESGGDCYCNWCWFDGNVITTPVATTATAPATTPTVPVTVPTTAPTVYIPTVMSTPTATVTANNTTTRPVTTTTNVPTTTTSRTNGNFTVSQTTTVSISTATTAYVYPTWATTTSSNWNTTATTASSSIYTTATTVSQTTDTTTESQTTNATTESQTTNATTASQTTNATTASQTTNATTASQTTNSTVARYTITLNLNGGQLPPDTALTYLTSSGSAPGVLTSYRLPTPTRSGYTFGGWFTQQMGGTLVVSGTSSGTVFTSDSTVWAQWISASTTTVATTTRATTAATTTTRATTVATTTTRVTTVATTTTRATTTTATTNNSGGNLIQNISANQVVENMGVGWNLGNTFDAVDDNQANGLFNYNNMGTMTSSNIIAIETAWLGNTSSQTTQAMIRAVKAQGFDTIRIPVTWYKATNANNKNLAGNSYQINADWMKRVKQVVDWAIAEDMYVILNTHHEEAVIPLGSSGRTQAIRYVNTIWAQIAKEFRNYDHRLVFEGLNEPREKNGEGEWWGGNATSRETLNQLNKAFVDTVRADGGNNRYRVLMVTTYAAGAQQGSPVFSGYVIPTDTTSGSVNKIILSLHTYSPFAWAHDGTAGTSYGSGENTLTKIRNDLNYAQTQARTLGVPIVLGEWGSIAACNRAQRVTHAEDYVREARARGMATVYWDNGGFSTGVKGSGFGLMRRNNLEWVYPDIVAAIMKGKNAPFVRQ